MVASEAFVASIFADSGDKPRFVAARLAFQYALDFRFLFAYLSSRIVALLASSLVNGVTAATRFALDSFHAGFFTTFVILRCRCPSDAGSGVESSH